MQTDLIKLTTNDYKSVEIPKELAVRCNVVDDILKDIPDLTSCPVPVSEEELARVLEWLRKHEDTNEFREAFWGKPQENPVFIKDVLDMIKIADKLGVQDCVNEGKKYISLNLFSHKTAQQLFEMFKVAPEDITEEQLEAVSKEQGWLF